MSEKDIKKCKYCKHWVFGNCMVMDRCIEPHMVCNAWEISRVAEWKDENARLKDYISKLEAPVPERNLQLAKASLRITELEAFIGKLIEAGEKMFTFVIAATDAYDEGMRVWDEIVNDWKEG